MIVRVEALFRKNLLIPLISVRNRFHFPEKSSSIRDLGVNSPGFFAADHSELA